MGFLSYVFKTYELYKVEVNDSHNVKIEYNVYNFFIVHKIQMSNK